MISAKKSYGQHFLTNESIAGKIAQALEVFEPLDRLLEVGPGTGMLTKYLIGKHPDCTLVDADRDMIKFLSDNPEFKTCRLIQADFLRLDLFAIFNHQPFYIIGNFPYNISSQIVFKMIEYREVIPGMIGMFQREMASRIAHPPGSREYGVISVLTQAYYQVDYLFTVAEHHFNPPPKVKSGVLRFTRKKVLHLECDEEKFRMVVKTCFQQKRKMVRNSLKSLMPAELLVDKFFDRRPEQLSVEDYVGITQKLNTGRPADQPPSETLR
jgi:16S rRNA (adenine1518-N6/adenine1519-N6)-dimethyltransferase